MDSKVGIGTPGAEDLEQVGHGDGYHVLVDHAVLVGLTEGALIIAGCWEDDVEIECAQQQATARVGEDGGEL